MADRLYSVSYRKSGRQFSTDVYADSWEEAEAHLLALKHTGVVDGEVVARYKTNVLSHAWVEPFVRARVWFLNRVRSNG